MYCLDHATPELFAALAAAQGEIENASKNAANPHFRSRYADLAEVLNTARPVLSKHGLSLTQFPSYDGTLAHVTTVLAHSSGGYISGTASCVPAKADAQGIGSASTYCRRYGAAAIVGIAQEDDDGNAAAHNDKPAPITPEAKAAAADFKAALESATDETELSRIGKELSASGLPSALLTSLRALYSARRKAVSA